MKKVLFICVENACRSQMAKGFFNSYSKKTLADSAGTQPAEKVDPVALKVMGEKDIDISCYAPKMINFPITKKYDFIVTMGCIDSCPVIPKKKTVEWDIENPKGKNIVFYRMIRDKIEDNVGKLINEVIWI